ncbi:MAG: hypothetical protein L7F78_12120, partial [Syntrophales bacterium LBB04]|nr:hypothetical protein [Syntrophales bacterium LBB04]
VGQAIDRDGEEPGVTEDDLVGASGGRVALVGGAHVVGQTAAQVGQSLDEGQGGLAAPLLALGAGLIVAVAVVAYGPAYLGGQALEEVAHLLAQVVFQPHRVQAGLVEVAGEKDAPGQQQYLHHLLAGGDGRRTDMGEALLARAGGDQFVHHLGNGQGELVQVGGLWLAALYFGQRGKTTFHACPSTDGPAVGQYCNYDIPD